MVDKKTHQVICTDFSNGKKHDFRLFKESKILIHPKVKAITDTGYQGIQKIHNNSELPKKKSKKNPLTKNDKKNNRRLAGERVLNENVIGMLKRFKIIADKYRNRRKRFGLRFNLISGIYNFELRQPVSKEVYLICDNASYHKSKKVKEYLVNTKIELVFLPPYSPNLNPIERLWKFMHRITTNNKFYHNFEQFSEAINKFFSNIGDYKDRLRTLINDNFQTITVNHFCNSSG